jgi:hypothetical protein
VRRRLIRGRPALVNEAIVARIRRRGSVVVALPVDG